MSSLKSVSQNLNNRKGDSYFFPPWFLGTAVEFAEFLCRRQLSFAFSDEVKECWF